LAYSRGVCLLRRIGVAGAPGLNCLIERL